MSEAGANTGPVARLDEIGIDVTDLDRSAVFWSELLGLKPAPRRGDDTYPYLSFERLANGIKIYLQRVPEKKTSKTRVHLDVATRDLEVALAKVKSLGGQEVRRVQELGNEWIVVLDPDGNEFCLTRGEG